MPTSNSCTTCVDDLDMIHDCTPDEWMTSQLNEALIRKLHGSLICLAHFLDMLSKGVCTMYNQVLADVRSTAEGIKCLYCTSQIWGLSERFPLSSSLTLCRHLISALNAQAARAYHTTACPITTQFPGHEFMNDLSNKLSFHSQATWVFDVLGLFFLHYSCVFLQSGTDGRPVDLSRN